MIPRLLTVGALTGAAALLPAGAGVATTPGEDAVERYDLQVELGADGVADITLDLDVDFGEDANRGPYLTWVVKQRFDETRDRVYRFGDVRVSSSTGASTEVEVEDESGLLQIRIGEEDRRDLTGVHSYRITFDVEGWVNSTAAFDQLERDELYVDVYDGWAIPIRTATVTVTGPADVVEATCFAGPSGSTTPCSAARADGRTAVYSQDGSVAGEGLTVVAAFPPGTFADVQPVLQDRWAAQRAFALTPASGAAALAALVLGGLGLSGLLRRRGLDQQFQGLTPGLQPAPGAPATVGPRRRTPPTVRFTPPAGFRPGQVGTLVDERADAHDVTATLVDLAVRGHLTITQTQEPGPSGKGGDWALEIGPQTDTQGLLGYERSLLDALFKDRVQVTLSALRTTFAQDLALVQKALYRDVTERRWFRSNPSRARAAWAGAWAVALVVALGLAVLLAARTSFGLVGVGLVLVAVLGLALTRVVPARTAEGTAVLEQAVGFRQYLATAEANQIRFEEGVDVFSRYLPWAIAFGLTERWARVFADLAAQGHSLPEPTWYHGTTSWPVLWSSGAFAHQLQTFTSVAENFLTAASPGSSGSSGSGGFSGGGVGGGGGGSW